MSKTMTTSDMIHSLYDAIETAQDWTGMDWDSGIAPVGDLIRAGKRVHIEEITTWCANDGSHPAQRHRAELRKLETMIEDMIDEATREEIAALADELAKEESDYVESRATAATEAGVAALEAAESGDLDSCVALLTDAMHIEAEFGDAPSWSPALKIAKALVARAEEIAANAEA